MPLVATARLAVGALDGEVDRLLEEERRDEVVRPVGVRAHEEDRLRGIPVAEGRQTHLVGGEEVPHVVGQHVDHRRLHGDDHGAERVLGALRIRLVAV